MSRLEQAERYLIPMQNDDPEARAVRYGRMVAALAMSAVRDSGHGRFVAVDGTFHDSFAGAIRANLGFAERIADDPNPFVCHQSSS